MKSIKFYLSLTLFAIASTSSAQFVNSNENPSSSVKATRQADTEGWSRIAISYNPTTIFIDEKGADNLNLTGFSLGYTKGISISKQLPLFVEAGINAQFALKKFDSEDAEDTGLISNIEGYEVENKITTMNLNIPVNLAYKFNAGNVSIVPYAGINFKINILGKTKYSLEDPDDLKNSYYEDEDEFWEILEEDYEQKQSINMFDKKDTGDKDYTWKRFQMGWQVGVGLNYNSLYIGVGYTKDFIELCKKTKMGYASITLGYNF